MYRPVPHHVRAVRRPLCPPGRFGGNPSEPHPSNARVNIARPRVGVVKLRWDEELDEWAIQDSNSPLKTPEKQGVLAGPVGIPIRRSSDAATYDWKYRPHRQRYVGLLRHIARASGLHPIRDRAAIDELMPLVVAKGQVAEANRIPG